jgi:hypothetical protein
MRIFNLILICFICSCSAKWHYNKAIKKGLEITNKSDTIRITTIDSIPVIKHDTIVYEKYFTSKDTVIYYKDVYVPKTIREIRIENKLVRDTIRIKERAKVQVEKEETKQTKAENNVFTKFFLGLGIGIVIALIIGYAIRMSKWK